MPWLSRFYFGGDEDTSPEHPHPAGAGLKHLVSDRLDEIDARLVNSIPLGTDADGVAVVVPGRPLRPLPAARRRSGPVHPRRPAPRRAHRGPGPRAARRPQRRPRPRHRPRHRRCRSTCATAASGPTCSSARTRQRRARKPKRASLFRDMDPATIELERGAAAAQPAPRRWRRPGRRRRGHRRPTAGSGPTSRRAPTPAASSTEDELLTVTSTEALEALRRSPSGAGARRAQAARCRSSAPTRSRARPW